MTVDARQRVNAFNTNEGGAVSRGSLGGMRTTSIGRIANVTNNRRGLSWYSINDGKGYLKCDRTRSPTNHVPVRQTNSMAPMRWVKPTTASVRRSGRWRWCQELSGSLVLIVVSAFGFKTHKASTHALRPVNIMATLTRMTLGRKSPIFKKIYGPVRM
jgi:hypothetical protein